MVAGRKLWNFDKREWKHVGAGAVKQGDGVLQIFSGIICARVIDEIQAKAESGLYSDSRLRHAAGAALGYFDDLTFLALLADARFRSKAIARSARPRPVWARASRPTADRAGHSGDDHRHELGRVLVQREGGAGARRADGGLVEHNRRWRHADGGTRE